MSENIFEDESELKLTQQWTENDLLHDLKGIDSLVKNILSRGNEELYSVVRRNNGLSFKASFLGKKLSTVLSRGEAEFSYFFPVHNLSPYVQLLFECADRFEYKLLFSCTHALFPHEVEWAVSVMNKLVNDIRGQARSDDFKMVIRRFNRASKKRADSINRYIDSLFEKHSRMVVIRVDLAYKADYFSALDFRQSLDQVKIDWARMQTDLYKGKPVKNMLGFACTLEYGHAKGFHFHLLLFYDGAEYRKDVTLAKLIGMHWSEGITGGLGLHYNCNKHKSSYRRPGIGIISHNDTDLILNLKEQVSSYLVKMDYWVRLFPDCGRTFFRGNMPIINKVKRGRPRKVTAPSSNSS